MARSEHCFLILSLRLGSRMEDIVSQARRRWGRLHQTCGRATTSLLDVPGADQARLYRGCGAFSDRSTLQSIDRGLLGRKRENSTLAPEKVVDYRRVVQSTPVQSPGAFPHLLGLPCHSSGSFAICSLNRTNQAQTQHQSSNSSKYH